jgi:hypothetical protein
MTAVTRWMRRILLVVRGRSVEQSMDDELRYHIECEVAERVNAGQPPAAARLAALRDFGGLESVKEEARDARGTRRVEDFLGDLRNAVRVLRRNGGVTTAAVLTFALGIGAAGRDLLRCLRRAAAAAALQGSRAARRGVGTQHSAEPGTGTSCRSRTSKRGATGIRCSRGWPRSCHAR